MRALKQELKPFRDVARALEDCVGHEQSGIPTGLLGKLMAASWSASAPLAARYWYKFVTAE